MYPENIAMRSPGFSLLETLLTLVLFGAIGTGFLLLTNLSRQSYKLQAETSNLQQNMWIASQLIQSDLPAVGYLGLPNSSGVVAAWPGSASTLQFTAGSVASNDLLILRQRLDTPNTFQGVTYQLDASGGLNRIACQQSGSPCTPGVSSANTVAVAAVEALDFAFLSPTGWQASLPLAPNLLAIGVYMRLRSALPIGPNVCQTYPGPEADLPVAAASLGITSFVPTGQNCRFLRQERFMVLSLLNTQVY